MAMIKPNNPNNGKRKYDRAYGPLVAGVETGINTLANHYIYGENSWETAFLAGLGSSVLTSLGNLNGKMLDTVHELNNLPNKGRGFIPSNTPLEVKRRIRDYYNAAVVGFPVIYIAGMEIASWLYK